MVHTIIGNRVKVVSINIFYFGIGMGDPYPGTLSAVEK